MEQLEIAANTTAGENLSNLVNPVTAALTDASPNAVGVMLGGNPDKAPFLATLGPLATDLASLHAGIDGLTPKVASEVEEATLAVIDTLLKDLADVAGFVDRLTTACRSPTS